jgi:myo-inositol-1(or 4)-monophosphatase
MSSPQELLVIARLLALEAGALIVRLRAEGVQIAASKSSAEDVVTFADRQSEEYIRGRLAELRPEDGFFGEEGGADVGSSGLTWIVDPIDGTVNYLYGVPQYAVSIAVVEGVPDPATWTALAGAVINPVSGELFTATRGGGAFLESGALKAHELAVSSAEVMSPKRKSLSINPATELSLTLVGTGFAYSSDLRAQQVEVLTRLLPAVRDIRRAGAASLDLCSVAAGQLDAYFERDTKPWDHAAGALIAREAGARVAGLDGAAEGQDFILAAHPDRFSDLEEILAKGK